MTKAAKKINAKTRRSPKPAPRATTNSTRATGTTKLDQLASLLAQRDGASIDEMMSATGWQSHSVRGALAGSLKRRGLVITSAKQGDIRRYKIEAAR